MSIYYFLIEAKPMKNNPESEYLSGACVNCWVKADTTKEAIKNIVGNDISGNKANTKLKLIFPCQIL